MEKQTYLNNQTEPVNDLMLVYTEYHLPTKEQTDMLTLTVKDNETIHIGDDIQIKVLRNGNQTRVSIDAPREIPILREKLLKQHDNQ